MKVSKLTTPKCSKSLLWFLLCNGSKFKNPACLEIAAERIISTKNIFSEEGHSISQTSAYWEEKNVPRDIL